MGKGSEAERRDMVATRGRERIGESDFAAECRLALKKRIGEPVRQLQIFKMNSNRQTEYFARA